MPEQKQYLSNDPNEGAAEQPPKKRYISTDPNEGEPLKVNSRAQTWSDRAGMNEPTASPMQGLLRGSGAGLLDMIQGAVGNITQQLGAKEQGDAELLKSAGGTPKPGFMDGKVVETPQNFSGTVGSLLPPVAEMALGAAGPGRTAVDAIPRAERAGANFEKVMGAAKDIVVDVGPAGDRALRVYDLSQKGAYLPKPVSNFLQWVTSPKKAPLTYKDSRDFASAMSRLSAAEKSSMTPMVKREVAQMAADLNLANANAAKAVGKMAEYKSAMREYSQAMSLRDAIDAAMKHSKKTALGAAGLGGAYYLFKD